MPKSATVLKLPFPSSPGFRANLGRNGVTTFLRVTALSRLASSWSLKTDRLSFGSAASEKRRRHRAATTSSGPIHRIALPSEALGRQQHETGRSAPPGRRGSACRCGQRATCWRTTCRRSCASGASDSSIDWLWQTRQRMSWKQDAGVRLLGRVGQPIGRIAGRGAERNDRNEGDCGAADHSHQRHSAAARHG